MTQELGDLLRESAGGGDPTLRQILVYVARVGGAALVGVAISWSYRTNLHRSPREAAPIGTTLVLLTMLVATTALVVDNSVARAFSFVGALAIVRFRTVVADARDTAFVIFAVVAGMALGVGNWRLVAVAVPLVGLLAHLLHRGAGAPDATRPQRLLVRLALGRDPELTVGVVLRRLAARQRVERTVTARQGAALEVTWLIEPRPETTATALVQEVNGLDGVQHVELGDA